METDVLEMVLVAAAVLAVAGWAAALVQWRKSVRLESELDASGAFEERSREVFESLAGRALRTTSEQFLQLAGERLGALESRSAAELDRRREEVDRLIEPIGDALDRTHAELHKLGKENAGLRAQIDGAVQANQALARETGRLSQALRSPNVRGRYGEIQLERVVELSGMRSWCDFARELTVDAGEGKRLRPDLIVRLPNDRVVVVDAKTSLDAYLDAVEAETPEKAREHRERFAAAVDAQITRLSRKEYWAQFERAPEFVVMFVPGEQFLDAALRARPELLDRAAALDVILASPSTLIGLLRAVHSGWREKRLADSARELVDLGRELHERASNVLSHADSLGQSLRTSVDRYNAFVGSMHERLVPTLRRFEASGIVSTRRVDAPAEVDAVLRPAERETPKSADVKRSDGAARPSP